MSDYHERKKYRTEYYNKYVKGWKEVKCIACSGSGYYDDNGSPPCSACNGTGKSKVSPDNYARYRDLYDD